MVKWLCWGRITSRWCTVRIQNRLAHVSSMTNNVLSRSYDHMWFMICWILRDRNKAWIFEAAFSQLQPTVFVWTDHNHHHHYHHHHHPQTSTAAFTSRASACLKSSPRFFRPTNVIPPNLRHMTKHIQNESPTTWCFFSIYPCATKQWSDLRLMPNGLRMPWWHSAVCVVCWIVSAGQGTKPWSAWMECKQVSSRGKGKEWICDLCWMKLDKGDENWVKWNFANEIMFTEGSCPETRPMRFANSLLVHTRWLLHWMTRRHPKLPQESNPGGLQNIWKFWLKDRSIDLSY